ncbi:methyltransferase domain-containing protein [Schlesneria sp. T3-172]|uniref:methyltransferase domain-containing protein n=1 Tax=Schlesneria sphaerica TaxID=3373610 RepID=UPI0037CBB08A
MPSCRVCRSPSVNPVTDFGLVSISNQFFEEGHSPAYRQALSWQECQTCGVVQLSDVPPIEQIQPRFPWIKYAEPEGHLDETARDLAIVTKFGGAERIVGFTRDDGALLRRLEFGQACLLDSVIDLGLTSENVGMESVQAAWTVPRARQVVEKYGPADLVVARYALEHCHDAAEFLAACRELLTPEGYLLIEVPNSQAALADVDVTAVWEEHTLYFTELTLQQGLQRAGFETVYFRRVPDPMEDRLVWMGLASTPQSAAPQRSSLEPAVQSFANIWPRRKEALRRWAQEIGSDGARLAVFGAGHRASTLIDIMKLAEFLDCVIDDSPEKQKLRFPAGGLPIRGSDALVERQISYCLLVVNPGAEEKIVNRNAEYVARGGQFVSLSPRSPRALRLS